MSLQTRTIPEWSRFDANPIIHRSSQPLLAAQISFSGLHRNETQEKLDLFQFPTCGMAKPSTGATKILWRKLRDSNFPCKFLIHMPDNLFCHPLTPNGSRPRNASKQSPTSDSGCREPIINDLFDPVWNRHGSNVARFPHQVNNGPVIFVLLQMVKCQMASSRRRSPRRVKLRESLDLVFPSECRP